MPLTLITGPANAGKAELLFAALRSELARGENPWLVVPTGADAHHYRAELARTGTVLGVRVARFEDLAGEIARRANLRTKVSDAFARERILAALASETCLPAARSGYFRELGAFVAELESLRVTPQRLRLALSRWVPGDRELGAETEVLARLFDGYQSVLRSMGEVDAELGAARALDSLRQLPELWSDGRWGGGGESPRGSAGAAILFYGFDDLTAPQLETIQTLAHSVDAPVTVALTYEAGRVAFAGRAAAFRTLLPWSSEHIAVSPSTRHYAQEARSALGHLERHLFEARDPGALGARADPGEAIKLLQGSGERAELDLVAAEVRTLMDRGVRPTEIALVHGLPATISSRLEAAFTAAGVPFALERPRLFSQTAMGRGLIALLRCALLDGSARDLLTWLRTPGVIERAELVDRLELRVARGGLRGAEEARARWEAECWPLSALDRLRAAAARGPLASIERVEREALRLFCAPRRGAATPLPEAELDEARALRSAIGLLAQLRELVRRAPRPIPLATPLELVNSLEELALVAARPLQAEAVAVLTPMQLRARRVRALFLCGLQQGVFPGAGKTPAFLGEEERRSLAECSGLTLDGQPDAVARERYVFYSCVSRAQELLVLSWHTADDDGKETARSPFVEDVCDLFDEGLFEGRLRGSLGTVDSRARADRLSVVANAGAAEGPVRLSGRRLLRELPAGQAWSASSLETFACCPMRWFVEYLLRPQRLEPPPEPLVCGRLIHAVLKDVLEGLRRQTGSARLSASRLEQARSLMRGAVERRCTQQPLSVLPEQHAAVRRRVEADLGRYLEHAVGQQGVLESAHLELQFGFEDDSGDGELNNGHPAAVKSVPDARPTRVPGAHEPALPALELAEGVRVRGRIDRIDVGPSGQAVVYDYKPRAAGGSPGQKWLSGRSLQVALYMRACRDLLGLEPVGGFYQPVTGQDLRARGALAEEVEAPCMKGDRYDRGALEAMIENAIGLARDAAAEASAGELQARPQTCSVAGKGCMYPTICRCGASAC